MLSTTHNDKLANRLRNGVCVYKREKGQIIQCAQDNAFRYVRDLMFCKIAELSINDYEEILIEYVMPDWSPQVFDFNHFARFGDLRLLMLITRSRVGRQTHVSVEVPSFAGRSSKESS